MNDEKEKPPKLTGAARQKALKKRGLPSLPGMVPKPKGEMEGDHYTTSDELKDNPKKKTAKKKIVGKGGIPPKKKPVAKVPVKPRPVFTDHRHQPSCETVEEHRVYEILRAGNMSAKINHKDICATIDAIKTMVASKDKTGTEKRSAYLEKLKILIGPKIKIDDKNFYDDNSPKNFTAMVGLMKEKIPFKVPNKNLFCFVDDGDD